MTLADFCTLITTYRKHFKLYIHSDSKKNDSGPKQQQKKVSMHRGHITEKIKKIKGREMGGGEWRFMNLNW